MTHDKLKMAGWRRFCTPWMLSIIYATADEADAYMFYRCFFLFFLFFFVFFPSVTKIPDNRSRERLNEFS